MYDERQKAMLDERKDTPVDMQMDERQTICKSLQTEVRLLHAAKSAHMWRISIILPT